MCLFLLIIQIVSLDSIIQIKVGGGGGCLKISRTSVFHNCSHLGQTLWEDYLNRQVY